MAERVRKSETDRRTKSRSVKNFPQFFRATDAASYTRAKRICDDKDALMNETPSRGQWSVKMLSVSTTVPRKGKKRILLKDRPGRGRKTESWRVSLQKDSLPDFERVRKVGVKFSSSTLTM